MLIIRLQRTGSKNAPDFRVVLAEKHRSATKKVLEVFGQYHPVTKVLHLSSEELLKHWLSKGVELSPTVHNLLVTNKLLDAKKVKAWRPKVKEAAEAPAEVKAEATPETKTEAAPEPEAAQAETVAA